MIYALILGLAVAMVLSSALPLPAFEHGSWRKVATTKEKDTWYVDQVISLASKRGAVRTARAYLKCVPGGHGTIDNGVRKGLKQDGFSPVDFSYFVESVEIDCRKQTVFVSTIQFYDSEDGLIAGRIFETPKQYGTTGGSAYGIVSYELCRDKSGIFDAFKEKEPLLYLYP